MKIALIISLLTASPFLSADPGITIEVKVIVPEYPIGPQPGQVYRGNK